MTSLHVSFFLGLPTFTLWFPNIYNPRHRSRSLSELRLMLGEQTLQQNYTSNQSYSLGIAHIGSRTKLQLSTQENKTMK